MAKLTDTQLVILSAAAKRDTDALLPLPKSLKLQGGAATSSLKSLLNKKLVAERPAATGETPWREAGDGRRMALVIADVGLEAIGVNTGRGSKKRAAAKGQPGKRGKRTGGKSPAGKTKAKSARPEIRPGTKQALLIDLLSRKEGATIGEAVKATGWQAHSVRGAISGVLKKKLGLTVENAAVEGRGRVYRIASNR